MLRVTFISPTQTTNAYARSASLAGSLPRWLGLGALPLTTPPPATVDWPQMQTSMLRLADGTDAGGERQQRVERQHVAHTDIEAGGEIDQQDRSGENGRHPQGAVCRGA